MKTKDCKYACTWIGDMAELPAWLQTELRRKLIVQVSGTIRAYSERNKSKASLWCSLKGFMVNPKSI